MATISLGFTGGGAAVAGVRAVPSTRKAAKPPAIIDERIYMPQCNGSPRSHEAWRVRAGSKAAMAVLRFVLMTAAWLCALMVGLGSPAAAQGLPGGDGPHIATALVPESLTPAAGQRT